MSEEQSDKKLIAALEKLLDAQQKLLRDGERKFSTGIELLSDAVTNAQMRCLFYQDSMNMSYEDANKMMASNPEQFKKEVQKTLIRHANAINKLAENGMYFFDYGNAFLLEASRAGADILKSNGDFKYPSYVQDIMGPMCFDYGFGPFGWVCASNDQKDLAITDRIACEVLENIMQNAPEEIKLQMSDNINWIKAAGENKMVVGSQARILYADAEGRMKIA